MLMYCSGPLASSLPCKSLVCGYAVRTALGQNDLLALNEGALRCVWQPRLHFLKCQWAQQGCLTYSLYMGTFILTLKHDFRWGCPTAGMHPKRWALFLLAAQHNAAGPVRSCSGCSGSCSFWPRPQLRHVCSCVCPLWVPSHPCAVEERKMGSRSLEHNVRPRLANIIAGIFSTFVALSSGCLSMVFWKDSRLLICLHWDELCTVLCHWSVSDLDFCFLVLHTYECCLTYCLVGAIYNCLATNEACVKMKPITYSYQFFY